MHDFKLKNQHKLRALEHAMELLASRECKSLLAERDTVAKKIAEISAEVLTKAWERYAHLPELLEAGVAHQTLTMKLGGYADDVIGTLMISPSYGGNWAVIRTKSRDAGLFALRDRPAPEHRPGELGLPYRVGAFADRCIERPNGVIPQANLEWVLNARIDGHQVQIEHLQNLVIYLKTVLVRGIHNALDPLREVIEVFDTCRTYSDLIRVFPGAAGLFPASKPVPDELPKEAVVGLLKTLA